MTTLLRHEIVQQVRELPDEVILDLVRGKLLGVSDRSDTPRRRPRAPEAPIAGELAALRTSLDEAVKRFDVAGTIDGAALGLAREEIARLMGQVAEVVRESFGLLGRAERAEKSLAASQKQVEAEASARCGLATSLGEAETQLRVVTENLAALTDELQETNRVAALQLQEVRRKAVDLVIERDTTIEGLKAELETRKIERAQEVGDLCVELTTLTTARDALAEQLQEQAGRHVADATKEALGDHAALTMTEWWARTWKALAKEMKGRWMFAKGRVEQLEKDLKKGTPRANLVVPTDFDARERLRIASGHFERQAAQEGAEEGEPSPDAEADDEPEDGMREPTKKVMPKLGAMSKRRMPGDPPKPSGKRTGLANRAGTGKKHAIGGDLLTVAEIALKYGITTEGARKRIERNQLENLVTHGKGKRGPVKASE